MLAYERHGSGEPLVLLHGIGHRRQAWYPVLEEVSRQREVILVDFPGHGESPNLRTNGRPLDEVLREQVLELFTELGLDHPHIAGNSLGGWIALQMAAAGDVRSVTALSPGGFWKSRREFAYTASLFSVVIGVATLLRPVARPLVRTKTGRRAMFFWLLAKPSRLAPERAYGDFRGLLHAFPVFLTVLKGGGPYHGTIAEDIPTTIAWADLDLVLPRFEAKQAVRELPHATHLRLPHCGHVPMSDDPALIAEILLKGSS